MNVISDLFHYLKKPIPEKDETLHFFQKVQTILLLVFTCLAISFFLSIIISFIYASGWIENDYHAFDELKKLPASKVFIAAALMGPIIEEIMFRAPLVLFQSPLKLYFYPIPFSKYKIEFPEIHIKAFENRKVFRSAFYAFAIAFGFMHLMNYEIDAQILLFAPILVAPQLILGLIFGYVRIRLGFIWAIVLHGVYNGILVSLALIAKDVVPE
jgi:hypothetical protein